VVETPGDEPDRRADVEWIEQVLRRQWTKMSPDRGVRPVRDCSQRGRYFSQALVRRIEFWPASCWFGHTRRLHPSPAERRWP